MTADTTPHTAAPLLCGDGSILTIHIDEHGAAVSKALSPAFFDPDRSRKTVSRHEGAKPIDSISKSNDVNWCTGTDFSFAPSCSTAVFIGVAQGR